MLISYPALPTKDERVTMKYQQLTEGQRYQISVLREDNLSCSEIGIRIGVSLTTLTGFPHAGFGFYFLQESIFFPRPGLAAAQSLRQQIA